MLFELVKKDFNIFIPDILLPANKNEFVNVKIKANIEAASADNPQIIFFLVIKNTFINNLMPHELIFV